VIFTKEEQQQEALWAEQKKYHAARMAWRRRTRMVPSGKRSWAQWFRKMFGERLEVYARRMAKNKPRTT